MPQKTDAQKRAQKTYMEKFARVEIRMDRGKCDLVQAHASARGESVNSFIIQAIDEKLERIDAATTQEE